MASIRKLSTAEIEQRRRHAPSDGPRHPIRVVLEDIRSIHNVGSIFRTADAARVEHVHLAGVTPTPDHPGLHRTALGAQDTVPWSQTSDAVGLLRRLRAEGYTVAALEIAEPAVSIFTLDERHVPLCLVLGNEVRGLSDAILAASDLALEIPQYGMKHSLNVSVAFGIGVYAALGAIGARIHP